MLLKNLQLKKRQRSSKDLGDGTTEELGQDMDHKEELSMIVQTMFFKDTLINGMKNY